MNLNYFIKFITTFSCLLFQLNFSQAQVFHDNSSSNLVRSMKADATWTEDVTSGEFVYDSNGTHYQNRAILYSENTYQSEDGFKLTVTYTTGSIGDTAAHNLSFGLISDETDLSTYTGFNPFKTEISVYSIGANLTADGTALARGLNFTNGSSLSVLDKSGTRAQFLTDEPTTVVIEIGIGGYWSYRINGEYEASGVLVDGFDLTKNYHVAVYGQDDNGDGKSIQSIQLEKRYAAGERADHLRGTWHTSFKPNKFENGGIEDVSIDSYLDQIDDLHTLNSVILYLNIGASQSALHTAPHQVLESLSEGDTDDNGDPLNLIVPRWGDGTIAENDPFLDWANAVKDRGYNVKIYSNCEQFTGNNEGDDYADVGDRWRAYCDANYQDFIDSQPFHTGIWNSATEEYEVAYEDDGITETYPDRKYAFCYAEYILKDYALSYGHFASSWLFDSGDDISNNGDDEKSGEVESQRLYQAFTNAVHAGNPDVPVAFQNGRSTVNYVDYPFARPIRFEDFTFGHAFGGNADHASKTGTQFTNNYKHITGMTETNGYVFEDGEWDWDELIVGNFHSKLSTTAWTGGNTQAWEEEDFKQWNEEAITAGGSMTWGGPHIQRNVTNSSFNMELQDWGYDLLKVMDDHLLATFSSGAPVWARVNTVLPDATIGEAYYHVIEEGVDVSDPEGDDITSVFVFSNSPSWMTVTEDSNNPGQWIISGTPTETGDTLYSFKIRAKDASNNKGTRIVELQVNTSASSSLVNTDLKIISTDNNGNNNSLIVHPNPTSGYITVSLGNNFVNGEQISTQIFDLTGKLVYINTHIANSNSYLLNLLDLGINNNGTYILKINSASINKYHKIILN